MSRQRFRERILTEAYSWSLNKGGNPDAIDSTWFEIAHTPQFFSVGTMRVFNAACCAALRQKNGQMVLFLNDYLPASALSSSRVFLMYSNGRPLKTPISIGCSAKEKDKAMNGLPPPTEEKIQQASKTIWSMLQNEFKTGGRKFTLGWEDRFKLEMAIWNTAAQNSSSLAEWFGRLVHFHLGLLNSKQSQSILVVPSSRFSTIFREPLQHFVEKYSGQNQPPGWILEQGKRQRPKSWDQVLSQDWCPDVTMRQTLANHLEFKFRFNGRVKAYQSDCDEKSVAFFGKTAPGRVSVLGSTETDPPIFGPGISAPPPFSLVQWIFGGGCISKAFSEAEVTNKAIIRHEID